MRNFPDLGPPDLINLIKYNSSQKQTISTFLYNTGGDCTSSSSIAAYLNSLANVIGGSPQIWFGKQKHWKVQQATYAVYNAFSKNDVRVTVHIPGKVETLIIDAKNEPVQETDRLWLETFVSSTMRSLLCSKTDEDEDVLNPVVECRNLSPFPSIDLAKQFILGFETLFFEGPKLGCDVDVQIPTLTENYLVDCFLIVVEITGLFGLALEVLDRLQNIDLSVSALIAKVFLIQNEEVKAIRVLHEAIKVRPRDAHLLSIQAKFCLEKQNYDLALKCAESAVKAAPSEFKPWYLLVKVYTALADYENALLTLNSCPMIPHKDKFQLKRVVAATQDSMHLPMPFDVVLDQVSQLNPQDVAMEQEAADPNLLALPAANLKSTFAKAYELLTQIVHKTGWEQLLNYRAKVFVMEEEYRRDKTSDSSSSVESEKAFRKKRLCERWLDNLFMLLYEDLRAFKMWQAEFVHFQSQRLVYKKNTLEWEILGSVAHRLHNTKEAISAFENALENRFSVKATKKLLVYYQQERQKLANSGKRNSKKSDQLDAKILDMIVKLAVWNHRWYREFDLLTIQGLISLSEEEGIVKVDSQVKAAYMENKNGVDQLMQQYFELVRMRQ